MKGKPKILFIRKIFQPQPFDQGSLKNNIFVITKNSFFIA